MSEAASDCGVIYYTRLLPRSDRRPRCRTAPVGPHTARRLPATGLFLRPGRATTSTFAGLIAIPPGDQELKVLRFHEAAFDAAR